MQLAELSWKEVDSLDRETPVVVPFAAIEQHGPHLPIGTDSYITEGILRRLDAESPESCLWLPVERYGSSPHHLPFPGTATLEARTFLDVARQLVESFTAHGFRRFVLFNGHGGNQSLLNVAVQEVRLRHAQAAAAAGRPPLRIVHATYWVIAAAAFEKIRESAPGGMGHACEMETSVVLALHPSLVKERSLFAPGGSPPRSRFDHRDMLQPAAVGQFRFWDEMSHSGVLGDPTTASAAKGERFLEAAAGALLELLGDLRADRIG
jgi:creatinine amidohydrolase